MISWIRQIAWGNVLLIGVLYTTAASIIRYIESIFTSKYYLMPQYKGLWSIPMRFTSTEYFIASTVAMFTIGVSLCIIYYYLRDYLPKKRWQRIFFFADILVACSFIFFTIPTCVMFNVPSVLLMAWFVSGFINILIASILIVHILSK